MLIDKVTVPEGRSGAWSVERFKTEAAGALYFALKGRPIPVGETFTRLACGDCTVMSDTPAEMLDHRIAVLRGKGSCLINGLGLGMVLGALLKRPEVTDITVVELSEDVINLVAGHYRDPRVQIVHASAFDYVPPRGKRYGMVWHDIWATISSENLPEMHRLHRKYARRADWQGSWARVECEQQRRRFG